MLRISSTRLNPARPGALLLLAAGWMALAPAPSQGQEVQLRYGYQEGMELRYEIVQNTAVPIPGMGEMNQEQRQVLSLRVLSVDAEGNARIRQTIEAMSMRMDSPMGVQSFDTESGAAPSDPAFAPLAAMVGTGSEITMAPTGEVLDFGDLGEWMDALLEGVDPEVRAVVGGAFTEEALESMVRQSAQVLPADPIAPGASWETSLTVPVAFGTMESTTVYTLREVESVEGRSVAVFDVGGRMGALRPEEGNPMAAMMEMSGGEMDGVFRFDVDRGVFLESEVSMSMEMAVMGQAMSSTTRTVMRLLP